MATCANAARQANALHQPIDFSFRTNRALSLSPSSSHFRAAVWLAIGHKYANLNANVGVTNNFSSPLR